MACAPHPAALGATPHAFLTPTARAPPTCQTISVAKAGITTVLNSRTSVLAAANPTFGRYDADKNAAEQVDFQSTILSRFDMIFILRDEYDLEKDRTLAAHILNIHVQGTSTLREPSEAELDVPVLRRYIAYAKKVRDLP